VLCSDDLGMKAVADRWPIDHLVCEGVRAGVDHFLIRGPGERQQAAWEALVRGCERDPQLRACVQASAGRVAAFKARLRVPLPAPPERLTSAFPWEEHRALAASFPPVRPGGPPSSSPVTQG
jgi:hypothetical protein